jgi:hypothetical protein
MAINRTGYSVGDTIHRGKGKYVVVTVKQKQKKIVTRKIVGNTIGKKRTFKL